MKCPTCGERTPDNWQTYVAVEEVEGGTRPAPSLSGGKSQIGGSWVSLDWMRCANEECDELVIRLHEQHMGYDEQGLPTGSETSWRLARPRVVRTRPLEAAVDADLRRDYEEATVLLSDSPRMSAVLSRRILAELLERYAELTEHLLADRIDAFIAAKGHPKRLRENLHYLRQIGNFAAHTQRDYLDNIIDVDSDEAAWTLKVIDGLFDYFIAEPETDRKMRDKLDEKFEAAGKDPIKPLPDEDEG